MRKKITAIIVLIILVVIIGYFSKKDSERMEMQMNEQGNESEFSEPLAVKYQYKDGQHVFVGDLELPNPCYSYNAEITDSENSNTKNLMINYSPTGDEMCTQVITNVTYRASYIGPEDLQFKAFLNGEEKRLNAFEVPLDVNIDDFELFIKG